MCAPETALSEQLIIGESMSYREWIEDIEVYDYPIEEVVMATKNRKVKTTVERVIGYEELEDVLERAYQQAAAGKGAERHATGQPFHEQPMQTISDLIGSADGLAFQAIKKIQESKRLPTRESQVRELLGAINYIAGMVIFIEKQGV